jgi:membrane protein
MASLSRFDWKDFFKRLYDRSIKADIFSHSAQIAFYFSFALFPLLLFLISLLGIILVSAEGVKREIFVYLYQIMPAQVYYLVRSTIEEIVANSTSGKVTLGLLFTLWSASAGFDAIRTALNAVYDIRESRPWWRTKLQSLSLTFVVTIIAIFILVVVFYGWKLFGIMLAGIGLEVSSPLVLTSIQVASALLLIFLVCELIYNLLPDRREFTWLRVMPGSVVAIVLWVLFSTAFRIYLSYYDSYNKAYGSLGAVIIMMLWLYLTASALMVGGAINSVLTEQQLENEQDPDSGEASE